ncbi:glucose 1-dehydrogenase [Bradyrhizobium sp. BRP22]|uniref:SDR family NAD(P)-dependent oxidoreductase n=1 Tax=Bradyrhizobium sp. BRP22 TaxID=2793821 RepID=UPI001CD5D35B|nr:glucose 1-dehydrogenase [Bradyrhizobium sp. BRP22]MCA1457072.1 glucose 1-dehydrogenase [Bradyrhizobium sp. BRP22]
MGRLIGKVAIITGAGSGQGAAEAKLFAAEGAKVAVTDINEAAARKVAADIGASAIAVRHDVTSESDWLNAVAETRKAFGAIHVLINSAGVYKPRPLQYTDPTLLDLHYNVNVVGVFLGMAAVREVMRDSGGGSIVNIASGAGVRGFPGMLAYSGSKWMVRGISRCAAIDLAAEKIRVNVVLPGIIDTPMLAENPPEILAALPHMPPAKRLGTVDEIAQTVLFLASDEASYIMGAEVNVCGGLTA